MSRYRVLHVDDEPDIREVAEISLGLDANCECRSCGSGAEALVVAANWQPDLILMDVMMPVMDGPATLLRLRAATETATIPVVFMTARAQTREVDQFRAMGAAGVIPKPFDPMTLAATARHYLEPIAAPDPLDELRDGFVVRIGRDIIALAELRAALDEGVDLGLTLASMRHIAHGLAGSGGIFGFAVISESAAALEDAVIAELGTPGSGEAIDTALERLVARASHVGTKPIASPPTAPI